MTAVHGDGTNGVREPLNIEQWLTSLGARNEPLSPELVRLFSGDIIELHPAIGSRRPFVIWGFPLAVLFSTTFGRLLAGPMSWAESFRISYTMGAMMALACLPFWVLYRYLTERSQWRIVATIWQLIEVLKRVRESRGRQQDKALRIAFHTIGRLERQLFRAWRTRARLGLRGHRRRELKRHARVVVAALRRTESRIDSDPNALADLATLLIVIAERYVNRRIGALLDPEETAGLQPVRNGEAWRLGVFALLVAAATAAAGFLGVAGEAIPTVTMASTIVFGLIVYGGDLRRAAQAGRWFGGP